MQNENSFDLDGAVQRWREKLAQAPAFRCENLDELETHLRDSVSTLQSRGLSADEAFLIATRRVGASGVLAAEFSKVNEQALWFDRALWMIVGVLLWGFVSGMAGVITRDTVVLGLKGVGYQFDVVDATPVILCSLANVGAFAASLGLCWWLIRRSTHGFNGWATRFLSSGKSLGFTFCMLCLLSLSGLFIQMLLQPLVLRATGPEFTIFRWFNQSNWILVFVQPVVLVVLMVFLARRRLRLSRA